MKKCYIVLSQGWFIILDYKPNPNLYKNARFFEIDEKLTAFDINDWVKRFYLKKEIKEIMIKEVK